MEETLIISKSRELLKDQDYTFLREEGLKYIENLASELWTDYNTHDPGITILEALCYAITELGYRTGFDIKDLMADKDGKIDIDQTFFSAKNILSSEPLTVEDYRKLLVDIIGVKNAWLYPYRDEDTNLAGEPDQEVPIYAHCKKDKLVYEVTEHPVRLHGLYRVVVDLDETDDFGDLNRGNIPWQFATESLIDIRLQITLPDWDVIDYDFIVGVNPLSIANLNVVLNIDRWAVSFDVDNGGDVRPFSFEAFVLLKKDLTAIASDITTQFSDVLRVQEIFSLYQKKIALVLGILKTVKSALHAHRCLCEDFLKIETICTQEVAFCADIEVTPDTDIEKVYAEVLFQIENYFNPEVKFYSLKELLNEGIPADEIFEGPILTHGFIKTDEIKTTQVRRKIYVSDIINFIMDIEGVLAVKNVLLTKYDGEGKAVLPSDKWCMEIKNGCKPVLNVFRSKVLFFKGKLPFKARLDETLDTLKFLHGLEQRNKLKGTADDLEMPEGQFHDLEDYLSVQYEFPITYGIGEAGLASTSTDERKAQSKQLKAYLMFYDQTLANFFAQLSHARELFSINPDVNQTYFAKFINDVQATDEIYINDVILQDVFSKPDSTDTADILRTRADLLENSLLYFDRRNRFLDHLIARFAESFNDYVFMLYTYNNASDYLKLEDEELVEDKIQFLKDYPVISSERGSAFDYLLPAWNTDNVSGLEKRIARLSGIDDFTMRFLFCLNHIEIQKTNSSPQKYFFKVIDEAGNPLLQSLQEYDSYKEVETILQKLLEVVGDATFYQDEDISPTEFSFEVWDAANTPLAESGIIFPDFDSREAAVIQIANLMSKPCRDEGMHLVEHILLRPRFPAPVIGGTDPEDVYRMFQVCLGDNCDFCGEEDPYSFRVSLILPYWHERFRSMEFRRFFEVMARTEAPAHCMLKICWVSNTLMNEFERAYKEWLEALSNYEADLTPKAIKEDPLRKASNALIDILKKIHSEYPEAQLHDCETGLTNPVLLGNTVLGTYKI
ncbi:MAG TPA: hypothetical protein VFW11_23970 [Cyclobacteriaceae bacterium]|nr:hypothetical protein [Cyclobacteriaceae bacterium]